MEEMSREMRLNWKPLGKELLVEVLTCLLTHENTSNALIFHWPTSVAHYLEKSMTG